MENKIKITEKEWIKEATNRISWEESLARKIGIEAAEECKRRGLNMTGTPKRVTAKEFILIMIEAGITLEEMGEAIRVEHTNLYSGEYWRGFERCLSRLEECQSIETLLEVYEETRRIRAAKRYQGLALSKAIGYYIAGGNIGGWRRCGYHMNSMYKIKQAGIPKGKLPWEK